MLVGGAALGAAATLDAAEPGPAWMRTLTVVLGAAAALAALRHGSGSGPTLWFLAGLAIVGGRGLDGAADRLVFARLAADDTVSLRARVAVVDGWSDSRWGFRTRVRVLEAFHRDQPVPLESRCALEVRGRPSRSRLPLPGSIVSLVARPAGEPLRPLLVVSSPRLLEPTAQVRIIALFRGRLAQSLLLSAGTDVRRIRAAETAAALALGRRDLIPAERREHWRSSGFAHLLAVSGLHVGIVGGAIFLTLALAGARPRTTRFLTLLAIPAFAVLAGSSPSAVRAALMGCTYLGARFLGRAVLPMAAVLLATVILLVAKPSIIAEVGFQLTVLITAALIRWVPPLAASLRGPSWLTGAIAVPLVAQVAAAPIVAWHFHSLIPGAFLSNLLALPLLGPVVLVSVVAALLTPLWSGGAALCLSVLHGLVVALTMAGTAGRAVELSPPRIPALALALLVVCGWLALQSNRRGRIAAVAWVVILLALFARMVLPEGRRPTSVELLPVGDGAAVLLTDERSAVLTDAGRYRNQAAEILAAAGRWRLAAVIASHGDEDHIGGMARVIDSLAVERLIVPAWLPSEIEAVPLLRAARRRSVPVHRVAAGSVVQAGSLRLEFVWPPARHPPREENERSVVVLAGLRQGSAFLGSDIGRATERLFPTGGRLACQVLVVPHHGSRNSTSERLLDAIDPTIALVPAAAGNTHGHPSSEVLRRLARRRIISRVPMRDEACGARWNGTRWVAYP
jgi:DNA internalization-related competence protein ComEC/Rec2